jgi:hypothetical protein
MLILLLFFLAQLSNSERRIIDPIFVKVGAGRIAIVGGATIANVKAATTSNVGRASRSGNRTSTCTTCVGTTSKHVPLDTIGGGGTRMCYGNGLIELG